MSNKPRKPAGLSKESAALWDQLVSEYDFSDAKEHLFTLEQMCREVGIIARLQKTIDSAESLTTTDRYGRESALSALSEIRQHRQLFATLLRSLNLPSNEDSDYLANGKMTRSAAAKRAANARWGT